MNNSLPKRGERERERESSLIGANGKFVFLLRVIFLPASLIKSIVCVSMGSAWE